MKRASHVQDASPSCPPGQDDASRLDAAAGYGSGTPVRSPGEQRHVQDIQDIIDKLAAVNQQLRRR